MRLFIGLPIDPEITGQLVKLQRGLREVRWVPPENFHVTLRFLGDTERPQAEDLNDLLGDITIPAFDVEIGGLGFFDRGGLAHALWAGVEKAPSLQHLKDKVESACVRAGFNPEKRKFTPHVTLARMKRYPVEALAEWLQRRADFGAGCLEVDRFVLYRSHLKDTGPVYEPLAEYPLIDYAFEA